MSISGPFTKVVSLRNPVYFGNPEVYWSNRRWFTQEKPLRGRPLAYHFDNFVVDLVYNGENIPRDTSNCPQFLDGAWDVAYAKAYAKYKSSISEASQWAVNLLEGKQSLGMISARLMQLYRFSKCVARFDYGGAAKVLKMAVPSRLRSVHRSRRPSFGNAWLEYHFGWEPLVKDIGSGLDLLTGRSDYSYPAFGKGRVRNRRILKESSEGIKHREEFDYDSRAKIGSLIRIANPNLNLAHDLGFTNPLSVAWELVPFSFVVDWFVNVGDVLGSLDDVFSGVSVSSPYWTKFQLIKKHETWISSLPIEAPKGLYAGGKFTTVFMVRETSSPPGPSLVVKPFNGFSPVRGLTAISLLLGQLRR